METTKTFYHLQHDELIKGNPDDGVYLLIYKKKTVIPVGNELEGKFAVYKMVKEAIEWNDISLISHAISLVKLDDDCIAHIMLGRGSLFEA